MSHELDHMQLTTADTPHKISQAGTRVRRLSTGRLGVVSGADTDPRCVWVRYDGQATEQRHLMTNLEIDHS